MTLPHRLTDQSFPPEPGAAARIVARARRRRRTRTGGTLAVAASFAAGVALLVPHTETASLRPANDPVADRETVQNRPDVPCDESVTMTLRPHGPEEKYQTCTRFSWPATQPYDDPLRFTVEWCMLDRDLTTSLHAWPWISVVSPDKTLAWRTSLTVPNPHETLPAQTCWRWHVRWDGVGETFGPAGYTGNARLPRGSYNVIVRGPGGSDGSSFGHGTSNPGAQRTLSIT